MKLKLLFALFFLSNCFSSYAQWNQINSPTSKDLFSIFFVNDTIGFVTDGDSLIYKTVDGGTNWMSYLISANSYTTMKSIYFLNKDTGFVVGGDISGGLIAKTIDGGITWNLQAIGLLPLESVRFYNDLIGFAVGTSFQGGQCCMTIDGGQSWTVSTTFFQDLKAVFPISPSVIFAGANSVLIVSANGGNSWSGLYVLPFGSVFRGIWFTSIDTGYAVGQDQNLEGVIIKTIDGGMSWNILSSNVFLSLTAIQFLTQDLGYIVGSGGLVLRTDDSGNSWVQENSSVTTALFSVHFPSGNTGYACGINGKIIKRNTIPTPIGEHKDNSIGISVFPNIVSNFINIDIKNLENKYYNLKIYNIQGKCVRNITDNANELQLDCTNLVAGMYFYMINLDEKTLKSGKIIVNK